MKRRSVAATVAVCCAVWIAVVGGGTCALAGSTDAALQLQDAFTSVAEKAFPAVVVITNKRIEQRPMYPQLPPEFRYFFGIPEQEQGQERPQAKQVPRPVGKGSGIVLRSDGFILTNYHVIKDADQLEVELSDGRVFDGAKGEDEVRIVGTDEATDLAVLQIGNGTLKGLPCLGFADSDAVKVGQWAIAVGAPFNLDYSVTVGVVSQKGRHDVGMSTFENYIQTDASINPGNSGGPLLDIKGDVIGISNFIVTGGPSRGSIGLGFAIASNLAKQVSDSLIENGEVVRPFLGIGMQELTDDLREQFNVDAGVLVSEVMEGDPADKAGIEPGDVVLKIGDKRVRTPNDLLFAVLNYRPGDEIKVTVDRRGKTKEFTVIARRRGDKGSSSKPAIRGRDDLLNQIGLAIEDGEEGVVVTGVVGGSPADAANMRRGDVILEVNRREVTKSKDVIASLEKTKNGIAVFYVDRQGSKFFVPVKTKGE